MTMVAADWTITRSTGAIRYIGAAHGAAAASYGTAIEFHRFLQGFSDNATSSGDDQLDATDVLPSSRATDNFITLLGSYNIDATAAEHLYDGSVVQGSAGTEEYFDGIVNFGNAGVVIQVLQSGAPIASDYWNYNVGGTDSISAAAAFMTDSTKAFTVNQYVGFVIRNTSDGSKALITANTATTVTGVLFGGVTNLWDSADTYQISAGINADAAQGISHRFMIRTRTAGADVDGRRLIGTCRTFGKTSNEFKINGTSRGNNVLALSDATDLNNTTAIATVAGWTDVYMNRAASGTTVSGINAAGQAVLNVVSGAVFAAGDFIQTGVATDVNEYQILSKSVNALTLNRNLVVATAGAETVYDMSYGYNLLDVDGNAVNESYFSQWDKGAKTINQLYERMKYLQADSTTAFLHGISGERFRGITHEVTINTPTGTWATCEGVSWGAGATAGTGQMLAVNSPTAATKMWLQLLTGVAPSGTLVITGAISAATGATNGAVVDRSSLITKPFIGISTGSALIGGYGIGLQTTDLAATDKVFDLTNTLVTPPNNVTFAVNGVVATEDYVLVGPWDGTAVDVNGSPEIDYNQLSLLAAITTDNITTVTIGGTGATGTTIPTDTPSTGFIRVKDNAGKFRKLHYTARSTTAFTIDTTDGQEDFAASNAAANNLVWISYIDKLATATSESFTFVYLADRKFVIKVRDGGASPIKEYITAGTMGSNGGSTTAIRTADL